MTEMKVDYIHIILRGGLLAIVCTLLSVVWVNDPMLPAGELSGQWAYLAKAAMGAATGLLLLAFVYYKKRYDMGRDFYQVVVWSLIALAASEAVYGLRQLYGFTSSHHSLYSLTGSFFNPGPYSGYLAMVFPLCLDQWLKLRKRINKNWIEWTGYYGALAVLFLILWVLPAGMSRSAWLATIVSGIWVYGVHKSWPIHLKRIWMRKRAKMVAIASVLCIVVLVGGVCLFYLKKDSASGRLFMWKISTQAVMEKPFTGYGQGSFALAYGTAQETYFAKGDYSLREELVAGSPEYAFNEYLQIAVERGIPVLFCFLAFVGFCLWRGVGLKRLGVCGGIISLLVFAFSSYPMQLPAFVISLLVLLMACVADRFLAWQLVFACVLGISGYYWQQADVYKECKDWANCRMLYQAGAYQSAKEGYERLYPKLKKRGAFLFEYGHCLHKLKEADASILLLKEASTRSCDPMILNIIGKNFQEKGEYAEAEKWLLRSTHLLPGRIYPYYLLAKLYAVPEYLQQDKLQKMAELVLTKEPKVQSTAVREMREEIRKLLVNVSNEKIVKSRKVND